VWLPNHTINGRSHSGADARVSPRLPTGILLAKGVCRGGDGRRWEVSLMSAKKKTKKKPPAAPAPLRPKLGVAAMTLEEKIQKGQGYTSAAALSGAGPKVQTQVDAIKAATDDVETKLQRRRDALAVLGKIDDEIVLADGALSKALGNYAHEAANVSGDDREVLKSLGVAWIDPDRGTRDDGPAATPTKVRLAPGAESGTSLMKWARPDGAAAFLAQFRLDPPVPGQPAEWQPPEGYATKKVEWLIEDLPPAATLRGRVRAIGAERGEWSDEVLGKAR
jgi:hypothetical protein